MGLLDNLKSASETLRARLDAPAPPSLEPIGGIVGGGALVVTSPGAEGAAGPAGPPGPPGPPGPGGGTTGTAVLDFSPSPGQADTSVAVIGQATIVAGSIVQAWPFGPTADHSEDEHFADNLHVYAGNIVPGVGFTVYGRDATPQEGSGNDDVEVKHRPHAVGIGDPVLASIRGRTMLTGLWRVAWRWS